MRKGRLWSGALGVTLVLAACGGTGGSGGTEAGDGESRPMTWMFARPADGGVIQAVEEVAAEYQELHPEFELELDTTPDRPSYLQKLETLAAADELPEFFDTDPTPFAQRLRDAGQMQDVGALLEEIGKLDDFRQVALDYQRFDDGGLYMLPLELHMEWFWYNTQIFDDAGVEVPETLYELVQLCTPLREAGHVPIAVDGVDQWPLQRYMAFPAFRLTGNDYVKELKKGQASLADEPGLRGAELVHDLGANECFQTGFSSQGYADARDLFTSGQAAVYYMGTWELGTFTSPDLPDETAGNIDFFRLPMTEGATTDPNEYFVVSGIGMAVNADTYDPAVRDWLAYLVEHYPAAYAARMQIPPTSGEAELPEDAPELYHRAVAELDDVGEQFGIPWDTQLDPDSNTRLQQELTLLAQGDRTVDDFIATVDEVIQENGPRFFGDE